jgi:hypothetical protein
MKKRSEKKIGKIQRVGIIDSKAPRILKLLERL